MFHLAVHDFTLIKTRISFACDRLAGAESARTAPIVWQLACHASCVQDTISENTITIHNGKSAKSTLLNWLLNF